MTSSIGGTTTHDGLYLLIRHWEATDPKGRILIVHGLAEHSGRYEHVAEFLVNRGYDVVGFDLRGHGASSGNRVDLESFDDYLDDVERVFRTFPHDVPTVVYGHSLGGFIAASYAVSSRRQPSLFVLSAPALDSAVPAVLKVAAQMIARIRPAATLPNSIKGEQLSRDPTVGERYFADPLVETKATARFGAAVLAEVGRVNQELDEIAVPMLVIHGADDELVPPHASAPLAAIPGVERKLFPGLRHEIHNEPEQAEVLSFVADWLDAHLA